MNRRNVVGTAMTLGLAAMAVTREETAAAAPMAGPSRTLGIEGAATGVSAMVEGPEYRSPEFFPGIEDYHNPRVKRLREEYALAKVVAGESGDFRRLLKLRHWVHSRWHIDNDQTFGGDAFAILEKAKTGAGFHCSHSMAVQHAVMV